MPLFTFFVLRWILRERLQTAIPWPGKDRFAYRQVPLFRRAHLEHLNVSVQFGPKLQQVLQMVVDMFPPTSFSDRLSACRDRMDWIWVMLSAV